MTSARNDMDDKALREWLGRMVTGSQSAPEQAHALLGWYLQERVSSPPDDSGDPALAQHIRGAAGDHQVLFYTARKCLDCAAVLLGEMCFDEDLPLCSRIMNATTLACLSWVTFNRLGPSECESLIEKTMQTTDYEAWGELSSLFQRVCECDPLWFRWKAVVRHRLPELADKVRVPLLRRPKRRTECRLVAVAVHQAVLLRRAETFLEWRMQEVARKASSAPPEE